MKILHVIASIPKVRGSISQVVLDIVQALQANNINAGIAVITL